MTHSAVSFSHNVPGASGAVLQRTSAEPPVCFVELLFSVNDVGRAEVCQERVHPM